MNSSPLSLRDNLFKDRRDSRGRRAENESWMVLRVALLVKRTTCSGVTVRVTKQPIHEADP